MNTKPTIYVHIGAGKTGTTSIQTWLKRHRDTLHENGYLIFDSNFTPNHIEGHMSNQQQFFYSIISHEDGGTSAFQSQLRSNIEYMLTNNYQNAIISSELILVSLPQLANWLAPFINECNIKIVAYVRNQPQYLISSWKEWGYWQYSFDDLFENTNNLRANWYTLLQPWAHTFGTENIYVGIFDRSCLINRSIIDDFATAINVSHLITCEEAEIHSNPSLNNKSAILLSKVRQYNVRRSSTIFKKPIKADFENTKEYIHAYRTYNQRLKENFHLKQLLINRARNVSTQEQDSSLSMITQAQLDYIYEYFKASNQQLISQYRPDIDVNIAFPHITTSSNVEYTDTELLYHGLHILFDVAQDFSTNSKNQNQIIHAHGQQIVSQSQKLQEQTRKLWQVTQTHDEAFAEIQQQFAEVQRQLQQVQQQFIDLDTPSRDLHSHTNPIKYWIIRIWYRITRRAR